MADDTNTGIPEGAELPDPANSISTADVAEVEDIDYEQRKRCA